MRIELTTINSGYVGLAREKQRRFIAEANELVAEANRRMELGNGSLRAAVEAIFADKQTKLPAGGTIKVVDDDKGVPVALEWEEPAAPPASLDAAPDASQPEAKPAAAKSPKRATTAAATK